MNEIITKERACTNCKFYVAHYVIISTKLHAIDGHCINDKLYYPRKKNTRAPHEDCGYWESDEKVKSERRESIKRVLSNIEAHLSDIKSILEIDK